ncbi:hypothetical protein KGM_202820 [Danaus plexippus plexippus]|uniref:Secreted protein n=1 Tax=Danaus plexippus plexippus TaxID=278856 RepID=A0A212ETC0_DANPL|nr:hypothetical protein KGM_202820 [Danaus plexippus plexippus]
MVPGACWSTLTVSAVVVVWCAARGGSLAARGDRTGQGVKVSRARGDKGGESRVNHAGRRPRSWTPPPCCTLAPKFRTTWFHLVIELPAERLNKGGSNWF